MLLVNIVDITPINQSFCAGSFEEVVEEIMRIRSDREVKKARISLPYYREMKIKRNENLEYRAKFKIARRRRG
jgi:hypothetical protein